MSFGKRGTGEGHPARNLLPPPTVDETAGNATARLKVANAGGIDKNFIALAVGVVFVSASAAIAAPSVLDMFGAQVRPIEIVVAGLDRNQAKAALANEAFPMVKAALCCCRQNALSEDHDRFSTCWQKPWAAATRRLMEELGAGRSSRHANLPAIGA
jgi:hypothetical protein